MDEQLLIRITADIQELQRALDTAQDEVKDFGNKSKKSFKGFNDAVQKAGNVAKKGLKIAAGAIAAVGAALIATIPASAEFRKNQALLETSFESAGAAAGVAKGVYKDLYRVLGDDGQATEAAQHLAKLTTNQKDLEQWTKISQGVYATFGASLPIESLAEAANETAKTGELTGALADALNWAGIAEADFQSQLLTCNDEAEREKLIRETLNGIYSTAAENYEKNAADLLKQNEAQIQLNEATARLGEVMAPVLTAFAQFGAIIMEQLSPAIESFMNEQGQALADFLIELGGIIGDVLSWVIDNWDWISVLATVILGIAAAVSVFSTALGVANAVMMANPVALVVAAIGAAIALVVALVIGFWDEIVAFFQKVGEGIKNVWNSVSEWVQNALNNIGNFFKNLWNGIKNGAQNLWNGIKNIFSSVGSFFSNVFSGAWNGIKKIWGGATSFFGNIWNGIKDGARGAINGIIIVFEKGLNGIIRFINSLTSGLSSLWTWAGIPPIPQIPTVNLPRLARGGIVDSATIAMVGESGKEAIVPLENNLEWLDKMSTMLSEKLGGGLGNRPIYLVVNKKVLGQVTSDSINDITKSTGKIPLVFA